jgi:hypothetical protein
MPRILGCLPRRRTSPSRFLVAMDASVVGPDPDADALTTSLLVLLGVALLPFQVGRPELPEPVTPPPRGRPTSPNRRRLPLCAVGVVLHTWNAQLTQIKEFSVSSMYFL